MALEFPSTDKTSPHLGRGVEGCARMRALQCVCFCAMFEEGENVSSPSFIHSAHGLRQLVCGGDRHSSPSGHHRVQRLLR